MAALVGVMEVMVAVLEVMVVVQVVTVAVEAVAATIPLLEVAMEEAVVVEEAVVGSMGAEEDTVVQVATAITLMGGKEL